MPGCQHKSGCDKDATYATTATLNGDVHRRALCWVHAHDALCGEGVRFIEQRVAVHGRFRRAAEHCRMVRGDYNRRTRFNRYDSLRVAVAADAKLAEGDQLTVRAEMTNSLGRTLVWGVAKLTRELGKVRTAPSGHTYRFAYVQLPRDWSTTYASVNTRFIID